LAQNSHESQSDGGGIGRSVSRAGPVSRRHSTAGTRLLERRRSRVEPPGRAYVRERRALAVSIRPLRCRRGLRSQPQAMRANPAPAARLSTNDGGPAVEARAALLALQEPKLATTLAGAPTTMVVGLKAKYARISACQVVVTSTYRENHTRLFIRKCPERRRVGGGRVRRHAYERKQQRRTGAAVQRCRDRSVQQRPLPLTFCDRHLSQAFPRGQE
jgi:hypothetical protein